jgi:hypothetical protein
MNADLRQALGHRDNLNKIIKQGGSTIAPLDADCDLARENWRKDREDQAWSRIAVRCLCANIEARLYLYRRTALQALPLSKVLLKQEEEDILREERIVIRNGVQERKPKFLRIEDSVKESMRLFAKAFGASFQPDCGGKGYTAFCATFNVRNRLMHPKGVFDLQVLEKDVETADEAINWMNEQYALMVSAVQAHYSVAIQKGLEEQKKKR